MQSVNKILVPTDFSGNAISAYKHALEIAKRFNATIDFVHIVPMLKYFSESLANMYGPIDMAGDIYPKAQERAIETMEELMETHFPKEYRGDVACQVGRKPSERICEIANNEGCDLIVMASKGKHETHLLRGSVTDKVIRRSRIPVFSVDKKLETAQLDRILLPTDGSFLSFFALPLALTLTEIYSAEIIFYHVKELYGKELENDSDESPDEDTVYRMLTNQIQDFLDASDGDNIDIIHDDNNPQGYFEAAEGEQNCKIAFSMVVEKNVSAHLGIESYAGSNADIVVMATHGRSGWAHLFLGSTAEKVSKYLDIPVATVRPPKAKLKSL